MEGFVSLPAAGLCEARQNCALLLSVDSARVALRPSPSLLLIESPTRDPLCQVLLQKSGASHPKSSRRTTQSCDDNQRFVEAKSPRPKQIPDLPEINLVTSMIQFEQTKSTKLFSKYAKHHDGFDPPRCILAAPHSPCCGTGCGFNQSRRPDAVLCLPELLCPPPRDHTLRSECSMDALNPGLLCPPDTREAPARRLRRPRARKSGTEATHFSFPLTISLSILAHLHPNRIFSVFHPL